MPTFTIKLSSVGQITVPKPIRDFLKANPGDELELELNERRQTISLKKTKSLDEVLEDLDKIDRAFPTPLPDPRSKYMTVGEMSLEQAKNSKFEDGTWV